MANKLKQRIERYLNGELDDVEKAAFETDLQADATLSDAFEAYLRDAHLLSDDHQQSDAALEDQEPKESVSTNDSFEEKIETTAPIEEAIQDRNEAVAETEVPKESEEKKPFFKRFNPVTIFLLGISLFFLFRRACASPEQSMSPSSIFPNSEEPSDAVKDEMSQDKDKYNGIFSPSDEIGGTGQGNSNNTTPKGEVLPLDSNTIGNAPPPPPPTRRDKANCQDLLLEADKSYKNNDIEAAQIPLIQIIQSENTACLGDAWFHLARIRLKLGDPEFALECLSKVDDLDKYGQDLQWYMALCFYEMAKKDDSMRARATGALKNVLSTPQPEDRMKTGRKLLKEME